MTLYMLFAGIGILIYAGVALAEAAVSGLSSAHIAFDPQFAFLVSLSLLLAADIFFNAHSLLRKHARVDCASVWRRRIVVVALVFLAGGVAILVAATREPGDALTCAGQCGAGNEPIAGEARIICPNGSQNAGAGRESAQALAAGRMLFQARGCVGCHRPDATGVGPTLYGLFGSPVQDPACGVAFVEESYLREAIENPSATVAVGFPPVMPTFAVLLTGEDLQALIEYVKSLSPRP
jgi:mono/diheme cytochrome c family protein